MWEGAICRFIEFSSKYKMKVEESEVSYVMNCCITWGNESVVDHVCGIERVLLGSDILYLVGWNLWITTS